MIEELKYRVYENIGQERPDVEEMTSKINELIEEVNGMNKVLAENLSYQLSKKDTPLKKG